MYTRRKFIKGVLGVGLVITGAAGIWKYLPKPPTSLPVPKNGVVNWNGKTREIKFTLGKKETAFAGYTINGQFPGPELRFQEGDRVRIEVVNQLNQPATLHWHGVDVQSEMDGVPGISHPPIDPGGSFTYEFIAGPAGTRWYHSHVFEMEQVPNGFYGSLIIEEAQPTSNVTEHTLLFSTLGYDVSGHQGNGSSMSGMNGMGQLPLTYLINGTEPGQLESIQVENGSRVRLINASATESLYLLLDKGSFLITHTDGNPLEVPVSSNEVYIAPAERYDVQILSPAGDNRIVSTIRGQEVVQVPLLVKSQVKPPTNVRSMQQWSYVDLAGASNGGLPEADQVVQMVFSGGMMGSTIWTINGKPYPDTPPITVKKGQRVRLEMLNMSMMEHPMHLHGHTFTVTSFNGQTLKQPLFKDTVNLGHMDRCTVDFLADSPGNWFFHCHNLQHMAGGLATVIHYEGYDTPGVNQWM